MEVELYAVVTNMREKHNVLDEWEWEEAEADPTGAKVVSYLLGSIQSTDSILVSRSASWISDSFNSLCGTSRVYQLISNRAIVDHGSHRSLLAKSTKLHACRLPALHPQ